MQVKLFSVCVVSVVGTRMHSNFPLEAVGKPLSLDQVGGAAGVDVMATLGLSVVDLFVVQPDLAGNEQMVCITVCTTETSYEGHHSPGGDEV